MAVTKINANLSGDFNVLIEGPRKLVTKKGIAETTNLSHYFLCVQQRDFNEVNITK